MKEKFKKLFDSILHPKVWVYILFIVLTIIVCITTILLTIKVEANVLSYILYVLSFLILVYTVYMSFYFYPKIKKYFIERAMKYKFTRKYLTDFTYRSLVSACISFIINVTYAIAQGVLAILAHSIWYASLSAYYLALCLIRGGIVFNHLKRRKVEDEKQYELKQIISYRNCGIYLNILTVALSASIIQMVVINQGYKYAGIMIYVMAAYVFYKFYIAIKNIFRARKSKDYTTQSIRDLNLADALMSMFALQTAMFQAFGDGFDPYAFNSATGTVVTLSIIAISLVMIIGGTRKIRKLKSEKSVKN